MKHFKKYALAGAVAGGLSLLANSAHAAFADVVTSATTQLTAMSDFAEDAGLLALGVTVAFVGISLAKRALNMGK